MVRPTDVPKSTGGKTKSKSVTQEILKKGETSGAVKKATEKKVKSPKYVVEEAVEEKPAKKSGKKKVEDEMEVDAAPAATAAEGDAAAASKKKYKRVAALTEDDIKNNECFRLAFMKPEEIASSFLDKIPEDLEDIYDALGNGYLDKKCKRDVVFVNEEGEKDTKEVETYRISVLTSNPLRTFARSVIEGALPVLAEYQKDFGEGRTIQISSTFLEALLKLVHISTLRQLKSARSMAIRNSSIRERENGERFVNCAVTVSDILFAAQSVNFIRNAYSLQKDHSIEKSLDMVIKGEISVKELNAIYNQQDKQVSAMVSSKGISEAVGEDADQEQIDAHIDSLGAAIKKHIRRYNVPKKAIKHLAKVTGITSIGDAAVSATQKGMRNQVESLVSTSMAIALQGRATTIGEKHLLAAYGRIGF